MLCLFLFPVGSKGCSHSNRNRRIFKRACVHCCCTSFQDGTAAKGALYSQMEYCVPDHWLRYFKLYYTDCQCSCHYYYEQCCGKVWGAFLVWRRYSAGCFWCNNKGQPVNHERGVGFSGIFCFPVYAAYHYFNVWQ